MDNEQERLRRLRLSRQADMVADPGQLSVLIIGCGGIGSNAFHVAVSLGYQNFTLVDPDSIGEENIFPGFFPGDSYAFLTPGAPGATSVKDKHKARWLDFYGDMTFGIEANHVEVSTAEAALNGPLVGLEWDVVIIGTDTLVSRRQIWQQYGRKIGRQWWIDGRMGALLCSVYCLDTADPKAVAGYEETLEGQENDLPCGQKSTAMITKGWIPAFIGQNLADIANGRTPLALQRYDAGNRFMLNKVTW